MDAAVIFDNSGLLLRGLAATARLALVGIVGSTLVGLAVAGLRTARLPVLQTALRVYLEVFRGSPLLVQMVFIFFYLAFFLRLNISVFTAAAVALTLYGGAYVSEIFRSGLEAIPRGQAEAARVLGFSRLETFRLIILPQSLRISLPSLVGQHISLIKDTSIAAVAVGYAELVRMGRGIIDRVDVGPGHALEIWTAVAVLYFAICYPLSILVQRMEARVKVGS